MEIFFSVTVTDMLSTGEEKWKNNFVVRVTAYISLNQKQQQQQQQQQKQYFFYYWEVANHQKLNQLALSI